MGWFTTRSGGSTPTATHAVRRVSPLLALASATGCCVFSSPRYAGPETDHFDGQAFRNQDPEATRALGDLLRWARERDPPPWERRDDLPPGPPPPERVGQGDLRVTFVGHSTLLLQMDGLNLLTDPIWSDRAGPVAWAGPRRFRPPGLRFEDLPPVDVVLLSHNHYDHLDLPTLHRLRTRFDPLVVTGLGNAALLRGEGFERVVELDWWDRTRLAPGVSATFVPAQHFSNRGLCDRDATLWGGLVVEGPAGRVLFAGDTGFGPHFAQIRSRLGPIRLALLPIGAFQPRWFMAPAHMGPVEAVEAHRILEADRSVAIHYGTFALADDGQDEPVALLARALDLVGIPSDRFRALPEGEGWAPPPVEPRRNDVGSTATTPIPLDPSLPLAARP